MSDRPSGKPRPWESEQAAFAFLLRVAVIAGVLIVLAVLLKAIL